MSKRSEGTEPATMDTVGRYLLDNYVKREGEPLSAIEVLAAIEKHSGVMDDARAFGSFTYYAGTKIGEAEGWTELEPDEDDDDANLTDDDVSVDGPGQG